MSARLDQITRIGAVLALIATVATGAAAQERLTYAQMREEANASLGAGQPQKADALARAMLVRDKNDLFALMIRARALRNMGQFEAAKTQARRAWALSKTDAEKFTSAMLMAQALSSDGARTRAQLWLRRAAHHAPTPRHAAVAQRDFGYVRQRNPWKTDLTFTFAPNSNINNGSARDRSRLNYAISELLFGEAIEYDLTEAAQAISGIEIGGSLRTRYRFAQTETTAHDAKLALAYRSFAITDDLGDSDLKGSDFAFGSLSLGYGFRSMNLDRAGEFALDIEGGQTWYGGARYASFLRAQAQQTLADQLRDVLEAWERGAPINLLTPP